MQERENYMAKPTSCYFSRYQQVFHFIEHFFFSRVCNSKPAQARRPTLHWLLIVLSILAQIKMGGIWTGCFFQGEKCSCIPSFIGIYNVHAPIIFQACLRGSYFRQDIWIDQSFIFFDYYAKGFDGLMGHAKEGLCQVQWDLEKDAFMFWSSFKGFTVSYFLLVIP